MPTSDSTQSSEQSKWNGYIEVFPRGLPWRPDDRWQPSILMRADSEGIQMQLDLATDGVLSSETIDWEFVLAALIQRCMDVDPTLFGEHDDAKQRRIVDALIEMDFLGA